MHLLAMQPLFLLITTALASAPGLQDNPSLVYEAESLVSAYVPQSVYVQLTASVASAASAASVTGDPASLFLSALLATSQPSWFSSAVPPYFTGNIGALESAVSTLREGATALPLSTSYSETVITTKTTNSLGSTITTSFTSSVPKTTSTSTNAAVPTAVSQYHAGLGAAALAIGLAAVF
ncbi:hypothetical protein F503_06969 [Ophiostoma piceae UAMH 11346]|uniref:Uncharacterized protein n=1 Tax=Ophiostoma piceae (strain UAMH 11346) TaxID=1262450 RepID=S3CRH1_OPHP1|nr:hypothetical protein F503_06969 [Ophiostoma piceae UAMH 11346]